MTMITSLCRNCRFYTPISQPCYVVEVYLTAIMHDSATIRHLYLRPYGDHSDLTFTTANRGGFMIATGSANLKGEQDILRVLEHRGFRDTFVVEGDTLRSSISGKQFKPEDLQIVEFYRFEGNTDVDDMSVIYGIQGIDGTKGVVVDAYGPYSDPQLVDVIKRMRMRPRGSYYS